MKKIFRKKKPKNIILNSNIFLVISNSSIIPLFLIFFKIFPENSRNSQATLSQDLSLFLPHKFR